VRVPRPVTSSILDLPIQAMHQPSPSFYVLNFRMDGVEAVVMEPECNLYCIEIPGIERESFSKMIPSQKAEVFDYGSI
jgi:hypothetical protein